MISKRTCQILCLLGVLMLCFGPVALAQEGEKEHEGMEHGGAMEAPAMGPPEQLAKIDFMLGDWDVNVKMRMDPNGEWQESTATATITRPIGGAVQRMSFHGTMMGMDFEGEETISYNRDTKRWESIWYDSMNARPSKSAGGMDGGGNLVFNGKEMMGGKEVMTRAVCSNKGDGQLFWRMEMSMDNGVNWFEHMRLTYTKK